jgi:hypothetical protein
MPVFIFWYGYKIVYLCSKLNAMKRLLNITLSTILAITVFVSCSEDDAPVTVNENPFALNQQSAITFLLQNIEANAECFTIDYPITLATYSSGFVVDETFEITSDASLISFLQGLGNNTYAIQYPFSLVNSGGVEVIITGNQNLRDTFDVQLGACWACDATNTLFRQAYDSQAGTEEFTMDTWTHEYTFSVAANGTICSIGYKGETDTLEYLIEILAPDGTALYSENHTFSSTETEYISIEDVDLTAGEEYTVRRSIPNYDNGWGIGTLKFITLPFTHEGLTIHESRFYGGGGSPDPDNTKLPFIDFVFKPVQ